MPLHDRERQARLVGAGLRHRALVVEDVIREADAGLEGVGERIAIVAGRDVVVPVEPARRIAGRLAAVRRGDPLVEAVDDRLRGDVVVVVGVVVITFFGTSWLGPKIGVSPSLSLLIATGFSICGASAVAAMDGVVEADEEEVTYSIALVTLCGSLAIVLLPLLRNVVGLQDARQFGAWVGASVHDVAQVIATSSTAGKDAVESATVVKLSRVVLLAPLVAMMGFWVKRSTSRYTAKVATTKVSAVPLFVVGFLTMIALRTIGVIPEGWLSTLKIIEQWCLAVALVGLGSEVKFTKLFKVGGRPLLLALVSWAGIAVISLLGVTYIA